MADEGANVNEGAERADVDVSPWARAGAMSDPARYGTSDGSVHVGDTGAGLSEQSRFVAPQTVPGSGQLDPPSAEAAPPRLRRRTRAMVVVGALVATGVVALVVSSESDDTRSSPPTTGAADEVVGVDGQALDDIDVPESSVGLIAWEAIDGDRAALPSRIMRGSDSMLIGFDDDGVARWRSNDGREWSASPDAGVREAGGQSWVVRFVHGRRALMRIGAGGEQAAGFAALAAPRDGFAISFAVPDDAVDGLPIEVAGGAFVRLDRLVEIPWRTVLRLADDAAFNVEVTIGDDASTFTSGGTMPTATVELTAVRVGGAGRVELIGPDGSAIWEFETRGREPMEALRGSVAPSWLRWDGGRFVETAVPWSNVDRVEVFGLAGGVLAVPTIDIDNDAGNAVWRSDDGNQWWSIPLPLERSARSPLPAHSGAGAVVVTISSGDRTSNWATTDGDTFDELPAVPGIERRSQGTFGWIAPDPRSSPLIRVSPDGEHWQPIDLSQQLRADLARWDLAIDATAIATTIYVTATHDESRTLLIGHVTTTPTP